MAKWPSLTWPEAGSMPVSDRKGFFYFMVWRKSVLMEDEGCHHFLGECSTQLEVDRLLSLHVQDGYFKTPDFLVLKVWPVTETI